MQLTSAGFDEFNGGGPEVMEGLRQHGVIFANNGISCWHDGHACTRTRTHSCL